MTCDTHIFTLKTPDSAIESLFSNFPYFQNKRIRFQFIHCMTGKRSRKIGSFDITRRMEHSDRIRAHQVFIIKSRKHKKVMHLLYNNINNISVDVLISHNNIAMSLI